MWWQEKEETMNYLIFTDCVRMSLDFHSLQDNEMFTSDLDSISPTFHPHTFFFPHHELKKQIVFFFFFFKYSFCFYSHYHCHVFCPLPRTFKLLNYWILKIFFLGKISVIFGSRYLNIFYDLTIRNTKWLVYLIWPFLKCAF